MIQSKLSQEISIPIESPRQSRIRLPGQLTLPSQAKGLVIFAHGSGSSRLSPRNIQVASDLNRKGLGTLLFDLLTSTESVDRTKVFDIPFLAHRLVLVSRWAQTETHLRNLPLGFFGASTGAAAAICAETELENQVSAIVSRGGRPDLASPKLGAVSAPTLLIVGGNDTEVLQLNQDALAQLPRGKLVVIPNATHLFEEPGALNAVSQYAANWFLQHFTSQS